MANGTPTWVSSLGDFISKVGMPTAVALALLWFTLTRVDNALKDIQKQEQIRTEFVQQMQKDLIHTLDKQTAIFEATLDKQTTTFVGAMSDNLGAIRENTLRLERALQERRQQP